MSEEFVMVGPEYDTAVKREMKRRHDWFITDFLNEKRAKLGYEKFEERKEKLMKEAEKAWNDKQAERIAREKMEEEKRREKARKMVEAKKSRRKWTEPTTKFLEKKLFKSKNERKATLKRYEEYTSGIRIDFERTFKILILEHLDKLENRKLKN